MSTPALQLQTLFVLNRDGRIVSTREPGPSRVPVFSLVRSTANCAWAVRSDVPQDAARELDSLAREEPPPLDLRAAPVNASRYMSLARGRIESGPAFTFPDFVAKPANVVLVENLRRGWACRKHLLLREAF